MSNDLVADLLTRIRNAQKIGRKSVEVKKSKLVGEVLRVIQTEGFVRAYEVRKNAETGFEEFNILLKYFPDGSPVISQCRRTSKSGRRVYKRSDDLGRTRSGLGFSVVSTSEGVMSDREARKRNIGGEVLVSIA